MYQLYMINKEVKMEKNKEIIEKLQIAQKIVNESKISQEYKQVAFQKAFESLMEMPKSKEDVYVSHIKQPERTTSLQIDTAKTFAGFLRQTNAKSHADKVLAMVYYFVKKDKIVFTKEDIEKEYQEAFLPKSKNTNVEINGLIKRGLLMPTKEKVAGKKGYKITMDGMDYTEKELIKVDKNDKK